MNGIVIIDIAVAAILGIFAIVGAKKGLLKSLEGMIVLVLAVLGAVLITRAAAPAVSEALRPMMEEYVEAWVVDAIEAAGGNDSAGQSDEERMEKLREILEQMGIDPANVEKISETVKEKMTDESVGLTVGLVRAITDVVIRAAIFLLAFVILTIVLKVAVRALDLVVKLPILRLANTLGGGAVSLLEGMLVLFVAAWIARNLGADLSFAEGTKLCRFFIDHSPLSILSSLM